MHLYRVIPLTNLPRPNMQIPSYYSSEVFKVGQFVEVPLGRRMVPAVIVEKSDLKSQKQLVKKSDFSLKKIEKPITEHAVLSIAFIKLAIYLANYYYVSVGLMLQRMLPPFFSKPSRPLIKMLNSLPPIENKNKNSNYTRTLLISSKRDKHYKELVKKNGVLLLVPQYLQINILKNIFKKTELEIIKSDLKTVAWRDIWKKSYLGETKNILGTRTALFTPFKDVNTIIVENENNSSHISWDMHPKFDARFAAEKLAELNGINLIEADTIPSISTYHKAISEKWNIEEKIEKISPVSVINMRRELKNKNYSILSSELQEIIRSLKSEEKLFLFIARKGLSSALVCRDCGFVIKCPECKMALVLHDTSKGRLLICHHCGNKYKVPNVCSDCKSHRIKEIGGGTQKVYEEVKKINSSIKIERIDSDLIKDIEEQEQILENFRKGETNVLISTQSGLKDALMPKIQYSAVVMLDAILHLPDYRSNEIIFENIWRIRQKTKIKTLVQTYYSELSIFDNVQKNDFKTFFENELKKREVFKFPPFVQLIKLSFSHKDQLIAERSAVAMKQKLQTQWKNLGYQNTDSLNILGPAPGYIQKVKGKYVWYMIIKWPKDKNGDIKDIAIRNKLLDVVDKNWEVEVDPHSIV